MANRIVSNPVSCLTHLFLQTRENFNIFDEHEDMAGIVPDQIPIELDLGFGGFQKQIVPVAIVTGNQE